MLAMYVAQDQEDWDQHLEVLFAYRSSKHDTTGYLPYYLLFGAETIIPADSVSKGEQSPDDKG